MERYLRNFKTITPKEQEKLQLSKVCIIGTGGIGGYVVEQLGRIGIGEITAIDADVFEESNLNRQILSTTKNIGQPKALTAQERMTLVNPDIKVNALHLAFDETNGEGILKGNDVVVDALDNISTRIMLADFCAKLGIPLVHGAISGWYGQISTVFPEDDTIRKILKANLQKGIEKELGNPAFTPAVIASLQVSETIKILLGRGELLRNKLLFIDLLRNEYEIMGI